MKVIHCQPILLVQYSIFTCHISPFHVLEVFMTVHLLKQSNEKLFQNLVSVLIYMLYILLEPYNILDQLLTRFTQCKASHSVSSKKRFHELVKLFFLPMVLDRTKIQALSTNNSYFKQNETP